MGYFFDFLLVGLLSLLYCCDTIVKAGPSILYSKTMGFDMKRQTAMINDRIDEVYEYLYPQENIYGALDVC